MWARVRAWLRRRKTASPSPADNPVVADYLRLLGAEPPPPPPGP